MASSLIERQVDGPRTRHAPPALFHSAWLCPSCSFEAPPRGFGAGGDERFTGREAMVRIFLEELEHFSTTQNFLKEILALHRASPISPHLEVETYTWDVLPERYRGVEVSAAIARELNWVRGQLR